MSLVLTLSQDASKTVSLEGEIVTASFNERFRNGAQKMIFPLVLAAGSLFLPVVHFVLTPLLLIGVVIAFMLGYRRHWKLVINKPAVCISCQQPLELPEYVGDDRKANCLNCMARYVF